jgi:uncharacterized protein YbjT (DUF2867 family)
MILITGATGKTGGEAARQLAAAKVPFRALVRNPDKASALKALGAEIVIGDITDPQALKRAMAGVDKAFLVMPNEEEQVQVERQFIDEAKAAGVRHIVYLSSLESLPESTNPITRAHVATEDYLRKSGLAWTMLRPTFFNQLLLSSARRIKGDGQIVMPAGNGTVAATDVRDVGEVIVLVLTQPGHENKSYDLTGPELLTMSEIAAKFSKVLGREVRYIDQPIDEFAAVLRSIGVKEWRVSAVCKEFQAIAGGAIDHTTNKIAELLGHPPISIEQFIADHRAVFS